MSPGHWQRVTGLTLALLPVAALFALVSGLRRWLFRIGVLPRNRMPVPVIVVGNITAGGTGKTPFVLWLVQQLKEQGLHPGVVTRGYRAADAGPAAVPPDDDPARAGDEPVLLARRSGVPVWRGVDRGRAARALLAAHRECDVIVSDDGLQHYRLARDVEIALIDGARGFGNGLPLPAGPLRESVGRLARCDFVVVKAPRTAAIGWRGETIDMQLVGTRFANLLDPAEHRDAQAMIGREVHAVAGIGEPRPFFDALRAMGLDVVEHPFPDHHPFVAADLAFGADALVVMTEKDAVKCRAFASRTWWTLPVDAQLPAGFAARIVAASGKLPRL
jgi:tetraacyldisaccharide 4'-kinase